MPKHKPTALYHRDSLILHQQMASKDTITERRYRSLCFTVFAACAVDESVFVHVTEIVRIERRASIVEGTLCQLLHVQVSHRYVAPAETQLRTTRTLQLPPTPNHNPNPQLQ